MILQATTPDTKSISYTYQFIWEMDKQLCLHFIDAVLSLTCLAEGKLGNLIYRTDLDGEAISLRDEYVEKEDVFATFADVQDNMESVGVMISIDDVQYFIEVLVDSNLCSVCAVPISEDADIEASPDFLMDKAEILAHVGYDRVIREEPDDDV